MTKIRTLSMSDVGTRLEHLADLQDLWGFALQILTTNIYHTEDEIEQANKLEIALALLEYHMLSDYDPTKYAKVVNNLPSDAKEIK
jgi:hypothetical protein